MKDILLIFNRNICLCHISSFMPIAWLVEILTLKCPWTKPILNLMVYMDSPCTTSIRTYGLNFWYYGLKYEYMSETLNLIFQGHSMSNLMTDLDSPYMTFIGICLPSCDISLQNGVTVNLTVKGQIYWCSCTPHIFIVWCHSVHFRSWPWISKTAGRREKRTKISSSGVRT